MDNLSLMKECKCKHGRRINEQKPDMCRTCGGYIFTKEEREYRINGSTYREAVLDGLWNEEENA